MKINRYELHLDIDDSKHSYEGTERIYLTAEEEKLLLNAVDLAIKKVWVNGKILHWDNVRKNKESGEFEERLQEGATSRDRK